VKNFSFTEQSTL